MYVIKHSSFQSINTFFPSGCSSFIHTDMSHKIIILYQCLTTWILKVFPPSFLALFLTKWIYFFVFGGCICTIIGFSGRRPKLITVEKKMIYKVKVNKEFKLNMIILNWISQYKEIQIFLRCIFQTHCSYFS